MRDLLILKTVRRGTVLLSLWFLVLSHLNGWGQAAAVGQEQAGPEEAATEPDPPGPLLTRYARTAPGPMFRSGLHLFSDMQLQEVDQMDGLTVDLELVVPFTRRLQARLYAPIYTDATARRTDGPDQEIDIQGYGGTFDYPNAQLEWQFLSQPNQRWNLGLSGGFGYVLDPLDTTHKDLINHAGGNVIGLVKGDWAVRHNILLAANAGATYYWKSDDLNPSSDSNTFTLAQFSVAGLFDPWDHRLYPGVELTYRGDFGDYNSLLIVPEVIWPVCRHFDLKAAATIGLIRDGEDFGAWFHAVVRF